MHFLTRRRLLTTSLSSLAITALTAVAPPPAVAAPREQPACQWQWADLPVPSGVERATVTGTDGADRFVGHTTRRVTGGIGILDEGALWEQGTLRPLGAAYGLNTYLRAVNSAGVAVGYATDSRPGGVRFPVRHRDGRYEALPVPANATGSAAAINEKGDVLGETSGKVTVWPVDRPGTTVTFNPSAGGYAEGVDIDEQGNVLGWLYGGEAFSWAPDGTHRLLTHSRPGTRLSPRAFSGDRIIGLEDNVVTEWSRQGAVLRSYPSGMSFAAVNGTGTIVGQRGGVTVLASNGVIERELPAMAGQHVTPSAITDELVVAGSRRVAGANENTVVYGRCV
ncbi:MAG TPA: hypothetical protein VF755_06475 [Catenuloplanes sp.]|jgi:hypothetical protein